MISCMEADHIRTIRDRCRMQRSFLVSKEKPMRKYIKKQILEIVNTLFSANQLLKKLITQNSNDKIDVLLQDMQSAAIEVGETIEKTREEGTETVRQLEKLCELIWQTSQASMDEKKQLCKVMNRKLGIIQEQIKAIPERSEVVFLPYKASMWDSLESVWKAADKDENCDAYVIPIPYFDKNPDGKLGAMHYEGELFPDYVSITDWQKYDLKGRHPEIIYIHNPYDEYNHVTSVHPEFYSDVIKPFTDKLVYIPYYVCSERTMEVNCVQKGVLYADIVVVQSDNIRKEYIKYCKNAVGESFSDDKVLALGSPKFDKVIKNDNNLSNINEEWKQFAKNRKVILYNTHLNIFLKYGEEALTKLESVFNFFKQRSDAVLLWRPHPLCKATLEAMRPELYERYTALENQYISEKIGIYDDGVDMYPAMRMADAYYGDESSLINLFGMTGKPVCIQNVDVKDYHFGGKEGNLSFESMYADGELTYFSNKDFNQLACMNIKNGKVELLGEFPDVELKQQRISQNMGMWKEKLWIIPSNARIIYKYDLVGGSWEEFKLPEAMLQEDKKSLFFSGIQIGQFFYAFGCSRFMVMKLDMETGKIEWNENGKEQYYKLADSTKSSIICRQDCCTVDGKIYTASVQGNVIMEYDCGLHVTNFFQVGDVDNIYTTICYDGKSFWLSGNGSSIIRWNKENGAVKEIDIDIDGYRKDSRVAFASSLYFQGYIWLFAYSANMNIRINVETEVIEKVFVFPEDYSYTVPVRVLNGWTRDDKVCFVDAEKFSIVEIDMNNGISSTPVYSEVRDIWKYFWEPEKSSSYLDYIHREGRNYYKQLGSYIQYVMSKENTRNESQKELFLHFTKFPQGNAGEMIHRKMMEE